MGRKIPAKKHRGVKDPVKQQEERWKKLKTKINAPPKDPDEQPVPRSLTNLFTPFGSREHKHKQQNSHKSVKKHAPVSEKVWNPKSSIKNKNPVSSLKRLPGESGRAFSLRINGAIRTLNDRTDDSYPLDLEEEEDVKGSHMMELNERRAKKRRREAAAAAKGTGSREEQGEGEGDGATGERKSRGQRLTMLKKARKEKIEQRKQELISEVRYERVQFGEVAHAPPALLAKPRRATLQDGAPRPGRRDLLLTSLLQGGAGGGAGAGPRPRPSPRPAAERMRLERARVEAVNAYRVLKKQRALPTKLLV